MWGDIAIAFLLAFITAYVITPYTIRFAKKIGALDLPKSKRKIHDRPMPRLGGIAVIAGFLVSTIYLLIVMSLEGTLNLFGPDNYYIKLIGFFIGLLIIAEQKITEGAVFVTRTGKPISRTNIWREMKNLCEQAGVNPQKVFTHNLRHLFARTFYGIEKDIARLADILGHSSINTTRIYIITTGNEHRQRMENMRLII